MIERVCPEDDAARLDTTTQREAQQEAGDCHGSTAWTRFLVKSKAAGRVILALAPAVARDGNCLEGIKRVTWVD